MSVEFAPRVAMPRAENNVELFALPGEPPGAGVQVALVGGHEHPVLGAGQRRRWCRASVDDEQAGNARTAQMHPSFRLTRPPDELHGPVDCLVLAFHRIWVRDRTRTGGSGPRLCYS